MMPGTGGIVAAVEVASGVKATVVGKEGTWLLGHLRDSFGLRPDHAVMIGDRLDTDVFFAKSAGLRSVLVLTGVASLQDARDADQAGMGPDAVAPSVAVFA